jgi:hypothetical protein
LTLGLALCAVVALAGALVLLSRSHTATSKPRWATGC